MIRFNKKKPIKQSNTPPKPNKEPKQTSNKEPKQNSNKEPKQKESKNTSVENPDNGTPHGNGTLLASGVSLNTFAHKASANELLIANHLCASIKPHDYVVVKPASGNPSWTAVLNYPKAGVKGNCRVHLNQYDDNRELKWNSVMTDHVAQTNDTVDIYTV